MSDLTLYFISEVVERSLIDRVKQFDISAWTRERKKETDREKERKKRKKEREGGREEE